mgnify:CR=1 FL=1
MYSMVKRVSVFALALLTLVMGVVVPFRRATAMTTYNNATNATLTSSINSDGRLQALLTATGIKNKTTQIKVKLYVEKRILGIFWSKVDIGYPDNTWTDSTTSYLYSYSFSTNLPSNGTYRVTVEFTFSGTGGADDIINCTDTITY